MNSYLVFKSLHLVSMVAWFAGVFYLVRLFVYHVEADERIEREAKVLKAQYEIMEDRLFKIIVRPAMIMTWVFGLFLLHELGLEWLKGSPWIHVKLLLVFLLSGYSDYLGRIAKQLRQGKVVMSSYQFRLFNEIPTLFLLAIILLAVYKNLANFGWTFLAILAFAVLLFIGTRWYRKIRLANKKKTQ